MRATGGAFGSALWRELMAGALDRPMVVVGGEDGTALGAAALGLVAVGAAPDLDDALALLGGVSTGIPVTASAEQVALFAGLRDRVARLLDALDRTITIAPAVPTPVEP